MRNIILIILIILLGGVVYLFVSDVSTFEGFFNKEEIVLEEVLKEEILEVGPYDLIYVSHEISNDSVSEVSVHSYVGDILDDEIIERFSVEDESLDRYVFDYFNDSIIFSNDGKKIFKKNLITKNQEIILETEGVVHDAVSLSEKKFLVLVENETEEEKLIEVFLVNFEFNKVSEISHALDLSDSDQDFKISYYEENNAFVEVSEKGLFGETEYFYLNVDLVMQEISPFGYEGKVEKTGPFVFSSLSEYAYLEEHRYEDMDSQEDIFCLDSDDEGSMDLVVGGSLSLFNMETGEKTNLYNDFPGVVEVCGSVDHQLFGLFMFDNGNFAFSKRDGLYVFDVNENRHKKMQNFNYVESKESPPALVSEHDGLFFMSDGSLFNTQTGKSINVNYGNVGSEVTFLSNRSR